MEQPPINKEMVDLLVQQLAMGLIVPCLKYAASGICRQSTIT